MVMSPSSPSPEALCCAAFALTVWPPARSAAARLAALWPASARLNRGIRRLSIRGRAVVLLAILLAIPLLGTTVALSGGLLLAAAYCHRMAWARGKAMIAEAKGMAEALGTMVAELRRGAPAALAAESAAADASGQAAATMRLLAGTARLGGDLPIGEPGGQGPDYACLAKAWSLSRRHGLPLAELLDAVRRDVLASARFAARIDAAMSGPRASAAILAGLPSLGLLLGQAMGAAPLQVLIDTSAGRLLLVTGAALILAGVAWSTRLTRVGSPR